MQSRINLKKFSKDVIYSQAWGRKLFHDCIALTQKKIISEKLDYLSRASATEIKDLFHNDAETKKMRYSFAAGKFPLPRGKGN